MILSIHFYRNLLGRIDWKCMYSLYKKSMADNQHHYLPCKKLYFLFKLVELVLASPTYRGFKKLHILNLLKLSVLFTFLKQKLVKSWSHIIGI